MKRLLLFLLPCTLFAFEALVDALLDGNLTHKITANYYENDEEEIPFSSSRSQKVFFHYQTAPRDGIKLEMATQSFAQKTYDNSNDNTIYYTEARYQNTTDFFHYKLSANYYADTYRQSLAEKSVETTNAFGMKAQVNLDALSSYVAYSQVMNGMRSASSDLEGKDHLLPTSSVLSSNNYMPNTEAYAFDVNYALRSNVVLGSRYVLTTHEQTMLSYTGVYTDFKLNELSKGLNLGILYDKTGIDKQNNQMSIQIKKSF